MQQRCDPRPPAEEVGQHGVHNGTHLAIDGWRKDQRSPRIGGACQESESRQAIRGDGDDGVLAAATSIAQHATIEHAERDAAAQAYEALSKTLDDASERTVWLGEALEDAEIQVRNLTAKILDLLVASGRVTL